VAPDRTDAGVVHYAAGRCPACFRVVQYGKNGDRFDYYHLRERLIDRHAAMMTSGPVRRWPDDWVLPA